MSVSERPRRQETTAPEPPPDRTLIQLGQGVREQRCTFLRLVFLASLRDPNSGQYSHPSVSGGGPKGHISALLQRLHGETFLSWLRCRPDEQRAQLRTYLESMKCGCTTVVQTWAKLESYRSLVPVTADPLERDTFVAGLRKLLQEMAGGFQPESESSRRMDEVGTSLRYLTTKRVSEWLVVPCRTLRLWAECGEIPAIRVGRQWRFPAAKVQQWMNRQK
jgi:excisionase family DNA binding protein